ncbi:Fe-S cluster assembly protein NifU [Psychromonas antarctica]|uniref:Fe-S cluster assembly protein NifU n=1 Tax=Psychromonas antarctica TaxID=67573 RepID=UPI001EE817CE|nr:Fe-S cluster assembly protein NifU [Psychromonas antarctica]MCG6200161.1 Fe-S cluster assembly protein NifU [Psychromonas antarctica]
MWDYSETVKDHFFNPRNAKALEDANAIGDVGSISCGDALRLTLKVNKHTDIIEDAGFQTFGCGSAIASSSALTELIIGKTITDAEKVSNQEIVDYLGGLPPEKMHCSVMGQEALEAAIANYRGIELKADDHEEGKLICRCFAVDEGKISRAVEKHSLSSIDDVINYTKAGGACTGCHEKIERVIDAVLAKKKAACSSSSNFVNYPVEAAAGSFASAVSLGDQLTQNVREIISNLRPYLQVDGGDVSLVQASEHLITVSLSGACTGCMMTDITMGWLQDQIAEKLGFPIPVVNQIPESHEPQELQELSHLAHP